MEFDQKSFNTKKYVAIALMAVAFLFLCMNWIKLGRETREMMEEEREMMEESIEWEMEFYDADDYEELFEEQGNSSKEARKMAKATEAMLHIMEIGENGKASVFTMFGITSDLSAIKTAFMDEDISGGDAEEAMVITVINVLLKIIIVAFVIDAAFMLFAIFCYVTEKKAFGVISAVLSGLMFLGIGVVMFFVMMGSEDLGTGITFAPILTVAFSIASCVVWRKARKMQEMYKLQSMYMGQ